MRVRYAELTPAALDAAISESPIAIWPMGALEWHGAHLPLGLDGIVAEAFANLLRARVGGVLLPCYWHPVTTLPHPMSLDVASPTFCSLFRRTAEGLGKAGFRTLCVVTGHYAQGHSWELFGLAEEFNRRDDGPDVLAAAPLEPLEDDDLLDHAGRWEAAQLLALRPDLVNPAALPDSPLSAKRDGILGEDPRLGKADEAQDAWTRALDVWEDWVGSLGRGNKDPLTEFYKRRKARYQPYRTEHYKTDWDQAIESWWKNQT